MIPRHGKRDTTEGDIIAALSAVGASVQIIGIAGVPDLLVGFRGVTYLIECKSKYGKPTQLQARFMERWRGRPVSVVRTVEEALAAIGFGRARNGRADGGNVRALPTRARPVSKEAR